MVEDPQPQAHGTKKKIFSIFQDRVTKVSFVHRSWESLRIGNRKVEDTIASESNRRVI